MKLYYFETPNGYKACAVAKYLKSPVEFIRVDLEKQEQKEPEFLKVNPNGKIPALEDGDKHMWESTAIMAYLADKAGSDLWPKDDRQLDVLKWLNWDTAHFSRHAGTLVFNNVVKKAFGLGEPDKSAVEESTGFFRQFAGVLDNQLKGQKYVVGDTMTIADFSLNGFLPIYKQAKIPLEDYREVLRWHNSMMELPACQQAFPG